MNGWSAEEAIAMERSHVLEREKRVVRQLALVAKLAGSGNDQLAKDAVELLGLQRDFLELSRLHPHQLEDRYGKEPSSN